MFAKSFNLILIYILSITNLLIVFLPILIILSPLLLINEQIFIYFFKDILYICCFLISFFILTYISLDCIFGFTIWGLTKKTVRAKKFAKKHQFINGIIEDFSWLEKKFAVTNIALIIDKSEKINAYAISSTRKKIVLLTVGLIMHIRTNCNSEQDFRKAIKAIMAHEISHLINKDYLPTLLLFANQKAIKLVLFVVNLIFTTLNFLLTKIPIIGIILFILINLTHKILDFIITFFYKFIITPIYNFLKLYISRTTEFRCDYQAALACGGENVAFALSFLGSKGYVSIFSTHPKTKARINYVKNVKAQKSHINTSIINKLSNFLAISILFLGLSFSAESLKNKEYLNYVHSINMNKIKNNQIIDKNIISNYIKKLQNFFINQNN
jgi:Zn-dependent protease with chaperone function